MNPRPVRNYQALNTPSMKRPALAIKSITGQTQFLVPVPHSSTKSKLVMVPKQRLLLNYIKPQVLKIPTITTSHSQAINSTGGAATGGQQSIRQYQSVAATVAQQLQQQHHHNTRCLPTAISVATSATTTADGSVSVSATTTTTHSLLVRSAAHKSPKVPLIRSLANNATAGGGGQRVTAVAAAVAAPKQLTDKQSKDLFMMTLGLVTKESLAELQSRKCERKRRTTANPQFSSAALEAKRITKLEIAERKAKRRLLNNMVDVSGGGQHTGGTNHHTTAGHSHSSSLSSASAAPPPSSAAAQSKTSHHNHNNSSNNNNHNNSNSGTNSTTNGGVAPTVENPKAIGVEQQEISPGLYIVTKIGKQLSANCFVCEELCECDCDSILFCKTCKTLFHATCTTSRREIVDNHALPKCLKCDGQRRRADELLARKRDDRDNLVVKKKEFEDQLQQMKRALQQLKIKIKEKTDEKVSLVANHEIVQQKVDKIIETLKLVEDTSEWEDELNDDRNRRRPLDRQSGPSTPTATLSSAQQTLSSTVLQLPPSGQSSDQSMDGMAEEEVVDDEEVEEVVEGEDDMDEEACRAAEQLVRMNAQRVDGADEELVEDEECMDGDEEEEQELIDDIEAKEAIDEEVEEGVDDDMSDNESTTVRTAPPQSTIAIDMDESEEGDRHLITGGHRSAGMGGPGGKHLMVDDEDDNLFSLVCNESVCDDYVEEVRHHSVGSSGAGDMDAESVGFFDTDVSAPTGAPASAPVVTTATAHQSQHQKVSQQFGSGS